MTHPFQERSRRGTERQDQLGGQTLSNRAVDLGQVALPL